MENKKGFKKILLKEIDDIYYGVNYSFYNLFRRNNITTVDQILDDEVMNSVLINCRKEEVRNNILGFIALIKYKYNQILIPQDILLDTKLADCDNNKLLEIMIKLGFHNQHYSHLLRIFTIYNGKTIIDCFRKSLSEDFFLNDKNRIPKSRKEEFLSVYQIIKMYTQSYAKSHGIGMVADLQELFQLKEQLENLILIRDNLDTQINELLSKIELLQKLLLDKKEVDEEITNLQRKIKKITNNENDGR